MIVSTSIINTPEMREREADEEPKDNVTSTEERTEEAGLRRDASLCPQWPRINVQRKLTNTALPVLGGRR